MSPGMSQPEDSGRELLQDRLSEADWEAVAQFLFKLLDDIDTASDMAKDDDAAYRRLVEFHHRRRFDVAVSIGHRVVFKP